ncbi:hypothetical protein [Pectobacterium parmentieri]|uniref:hypothetical protein n=1 Tax=Pectobacterium parmentieri TaxID=1905730 RepID=UPI0018DF6E1C|nr:hypothetical protein [Pectobacterium parmentieri]MBI0549576.1 hypothetical protein [Pectobacterium parmentieri]MBI0558593.1 hypothetical protein [Pectobacterium parmentieri]MBI0562753.1 hypothetical protein [Pectobacterium parmentieri]
MILKDIYLYPDVLDYGEELTYPFKELTRSLCNYLGRSIKQAKYDTTGFNRVCFIGRKNPIGESYVNSSNVLGVEIFIDENEYLHTLKSELNKYFAKLVINGLDKVDGRYSLPKDLIVNAIDEFENSGFINEWVFKRKKLKGCKFTGLLKCRLTLDNFFLDFQIINKYKVVYEENVVTDHPNDFVFYYHLNKFNITDDYVVEVVNKSDNVIYSKRLANVLELL